MKKNCVYFLLFVATTCIAVRAHAQPKLNKNNVKEVVAAMTLDEKAHLVVGRGVRFGPPPTAAKKDSTKAAGTIEELNSFAIAM